MTNKEIMMKKQALIDVLSSDSPETAKALRRKSLNQLRQMMDLVASLIDVHLDRPLQVHLRYVRHINKV